MTVLALPAGGLAKFILLSAALSVFNTLQCYLAPLGLTRRVYNQQPNQVSSLSSRIFGTWTLLSAVLRYQCAYNMDNVVVYNVTWASYGIALTHFLAEILAFRTCRVPGPVLSTFIVAIISLVWMWVEHPAH
ncbi:ergosterol biosynthesis protein [Spiromyces aspiralis]|uniref:Ergosterol biosynthesis protein n=1 Tax=Spiromyces aspiralis TaxID=68401 RepID=A0ACC1HVG3_9FUNG|nr:ergosterol biosynthesis protein [Spiromyces aspiralis]